MGLLARLASLILKQPAFILLSILLGFLTIESSVGLMAFSALLISDAGLHFAIGDLSLLIVGVRALGIGRAVLRYIERYITHSTTFRILSRLRVWFYNRLELLVPWKTGGLHPGDLFTRMVNDVESLKEFYLKVFNPPLVALCVLLFGSTILWSINRQLALGYIACFTAAGLIIPFLAGLIGRNSGNKTVLIRSGINTLLFDCFSGINEVISFNIGNLYTDKLKKLGKELVIEQRRLAMASGLSSAFMSLAGGLCMGLALFICIPLTASGVLRGDFLAAIAIGMVSSFEAIQPMTLYFNKLEASKAAAGRIFDIIDRKAAGYGEEKKNMHPENFNIEMNNVSMRYSQDRPLALENINFKLSGGAKVAIVGTNGSGKSSLLQVLCGVLPYESGKISIGGLDIKDMDREAVMDSFSVVPQNPYIFNSTVLENLKIADLNVSEDRIKEILAAAQLEEFIAGLPDGLRTFIGEGGFKLSGGQRQRLAIARALLRNRPILVLDEPCTGLDPLTEEKLFHSLQKDWNKKSVIIITHNTSRLESMDEIYVLSHGHVMEHGSHDELMESNGFYYRMRSKQKA